MNPIFVRIKIRDRQLWADFRREALLEEKFVEDLAAEVIAEYISKRRRPEEYSLGQDAAKPEEAG